MRSIFYFSGVASLMSSKITSIEAIPVRLARNLTEATGTAGTPNVLEGEGAYRWSRDYPALYSIFIESTLVKVRLENGLVGWGEAQAPLAPQVSATIIETLLRPALEGQHFEGQTSISPMWDTMYSTMRVRGQTGGFMLDAISGVDLALWDLAGKMAGQPVSALLANQPKSQVPAYISGLSGATVEERLKAAKPFYEAGFRTFKLYYESDWQSILDTVGALQEAYAGVRVAVDGLWHLDPSKAAQLDEHNALWLECPLLPESPSAHAELAGSIQTPLALGESYRTCYELAPFWDSIKFVQPDLGRSGLTESVRIAEQAAHRRIAVVPHVSIALGPQIAAAIHLSAAVSNCNLCEYNPRVLDVANRYLQTPLALDGSYYVVPNAPGLGIELDEDALRSANLLTR